MDMYFTWISVKNCHLFLFLFNRQYIHDHYTNISLCRKVFVLIEADVQITVPPHCNIVNFLQNTHNRHPKTCPRGQVIGCLLWVPSISNVAILLLLCCIQFSVLLDHSIRFPLLMCYFGPFYKGPTVYVAEGPVWYPHHCSAALLDPFHKLYEFIITNSFCCNFKCNPIIPKICTCHSISAVVHCEKLWPD